MIYDDKKFIGKVIRNRRIKANLTQAELAEKICMSEKNFGNIENGRQFPAVNNFLRIIELLDIPMEEFGIRIENTENNVKKKLIEQILNANTNRCDKYLKAINFIDDIIKK